MNAGRTSFAARRAGSAISLACHIPLDILVGNAAADTLCANAGDDAVYAGSGNDSLCGGNGDDILFGQGGTDSLYGDAGNDVLDGGTGNDSVSGGTGSDTYLFGKGDGQDTLLSGTDTTVGNIDTLQFKAGVVAEEVTFASSGESLVIKIAGTTDYSRLRTCRIRHRD